MTIAQRFVVHLHRVRDQHRHVGLDRATPREMRAVERQRTAVGSRRRRSPSHRRAPRFKSSVSDASTGASPDGVTAIVYVICCPGATRSRRSPGSTSSTPSTVPVHAVAAGRRAGRADATATLDPVPQQTAGERVVDPHAVGHRGRGPDAGRHRAAPVEGVGPVDRTGGRGDDERGVVEHVGERVGEGSPAAPPSPGW